MIEVSEAVWHIDARLEAESARLPFKKCCIK